MNNDRFDFTAEQVEEQVAWLRRQSAARTGGPQASGERQLIEDLDSLYQQERADERSLEDVRARLQRQVGMRGPGRGSTPAPPRRPSAGQGGPPRRAGWSLPARLTALVAAVLLVVVVGGLVVGLVLVKHPAPQGGHPTATANAATATTTAGVPVAYGDLNTDTVVAMNPVTGAILWQHAYPGVQFSQVWVVKGQTILVILEYDGQPNKLSALSTTNGTQRWVITPQSDTFFSVTSTVIVAEANSTALLAWDMQTGKRLWTYQAPSGTQIGGPLADEAANTIYASAADAQGDLLYAINASTGKERWHMRNVGNQMAFGQTVYVEQSSTATTGPILFALDATTGKEQWRIQADATENAWLGPTVANGVVYLSAIGYQQDGTGQGILYALDASTGKELWHTQPAQHGVRMTEAAVGQGVVYAADEKGLYAFNQADGKQLWYNTFGGQAIDVSVPVFEDGLVFVNRNGTSSNPENQTTTLSALDAATGTERWHLQIADELAPPVEAIATPSVVDGVVLFSQGGNGTYPFDPTVILMQALRASDGTVLWKKQGLWTLFPADG